MHTREFSSGEREYTGEMYTGEFSSEEREYTGKMYTGEFTSKGYISAVEFDKGESSAQYFFVGEFSTGEIFGHCYINVDRLFVLEG